MLKLIIKEPIKPYNLSFRFFALKDPRTQKCSVLDFLRELESSNRKAFIKTIALIERISLDGKLPKNQEKFKKESGKIYALKSHQVRLYGFHNGHSEFIFTNACIKKSNKADQSELDKAEEMRIQFLEANNERS